MRGAATFLASPWGGGSDAAREAKRVVLLLLLPHSTLPGEHGDLGSPLGGRRTGVGWACLPRARRQGKSQKMKPVLPSSHRRPFWPPIPQLRVVRLPLG